MANLTKVRKAVESIEAENLEKEQDREWHKARGELNIEDIKPSYLASMIGS